MVRKVRITDLLKIQALFETEVLEWRVFLRGGIEKGRGIFLRGRKRKKDQRTAPLIWCLASEDRNPSLCEVCGMWSLLGQLTVCLLVILCWSDFTDLPYSLSFSTTYSEIDCMSDSVYTWVFVPHLGGIILWLPPLRWTLVSAQDCHPASLSPEFSNSKAENYRILPFKPESFSGFMP